MGIVRGCMLHTVAWLHAAQEAYTLRYIVSWKNFAVGLEPAWLVQSHGLHGPINVKKAASGSMVQILGSPGLASSSKPADYNCQALREGVSTE